MATIGARKRTAGPRFTARIRLKRDAERSIDVHRTSNAECRIPVQQLLIVDPDATANHHDDLLCT